MRGYIGKVDKRYFEFSTVVDEPVTFLMTKTEFKKYYREQYGEVGMRGLPERLARADETGTSCRERSFAEMIRCNVYGPDGENLNEEEFKARLIQQTEEELQNE